jgi:phospholipid/cholesterol/gamma-HCH transport system ATP-binding protein
MDDLQSVAAGLDPGVQPTAMATIPNQRSPMHSAPDSEDRIRLEDVHLVLGLRPVFQGLTCGFPQGRITVLLGGSGAGKSTLLRLVGGLNRPDRGRVCVAGQEVHRLGQRELYRVRERIGMLFQGGALLDSMTIFENVALPLREHSRLSEEEIVARVGRRLSAVGLEDTEQLLPRQLSGGMLRRAALARAIVNDPEIVLCDEPFSGLDPLNVRRIESLLVELNRDLGITLAVTSHHIPSALRMADQIVFLVDGEAVSGSPAELLASDDKRVVEFLEAERVEGEVGRRVGTGLGT